MGELFDVLTLFADQGPDCLSWNKEVDNLLFWSLLLTKSYTYMLGPKQWHKRTELTVIICKKKAELS